MQNTKVLSYASSAALAQKIAVFHFDPNNNSTSFDMIMKLGYNNLCALN